MIIGGAEEEISLEALMAEVEEDVRQEQQLYGADAVDEEVLTKRIHSKMMSSGKGLFIIYGRGQRF